MPGQETDGGLMNAALVSGSFPLLTVFLTFPDNDDLDPRNKSSDADLR